MAIAGGSSGLLEITDLVKVYRGGTRANDAAVGLARARCLDGDVKGAARALEESALTTAQLRALAEDEDFAALARDKRYGGVLRLPSSDPR